MATSQLSLKKSTLEISFERTSMVSTKLVGIPIKSNQQLRERKKEKKKEEY